MSYQPIRSVPLSPVRTLDLPKTNTIPPTPTSATQDPNALASPNLDHETHKSDTNSYHQDYVQKPESFSELCIQNAGLLYIVLAQLFFALMGLSVKFLITSTSISTLTLIVVRMAITSVCCITALWLMSVPNPILGPPGIRLLLCGRGFFGFTCLFASYAALRGLSVSDSVVIGFLTPSVTALLGWMWLKENVTRREMIAGMCSLFGVVMISRPPFLFGKKLVDDGEEIGGGPGDAGGIPGEEEVGMVDAVVRLESVAWALSAVISSSIAYVLIRHIGKKAHPLHSIGYFGFMCTISCSVALLLKPGPIAWVTTTREFVLIIIIGVFGFCAQALLTAGLIREKAGRAGLAMYVQVLFSLIFEFVAFHTIPPFLSVVGMIIILTSALWVALSTSPQQTRQHDEESQPISRSPSPIPPPGVSTVRGGHYSYAAVATNPSLEDLSLSKADTGSQNQQGAGGNRPSLLTTRYDGGSEGRRRSGGNSIKSSGVEGGVSG